MLREAQQEEASRLGSKGFFDVFPFFFSVCVCECRHIHKAGDHYPTLTKCVSSVSLLLLLTLIALFSCSTLILFLLLLPVATLLTHSYCDIAEVQR